MLRYKYQKTNLFTVVDLFNTPNFIALWTLNKLFKIEFERGGTGTEPATEMLVGNQIEF